MAGRTPHDRVEEFERVALPHMDALYNLALHLTRDRAEAEDLVQETYLRAFRFFDSFETGTQIRAWLFRILRNTFVNRYRARRARPEVVDADKVDAVLEGGAAGGIPGASAAPTPERIVLDGVVDGDIRDAIDELPADYRAVAVLALVEEMSYRAIAETLAIPVGTVMSRLHRARRHLKARLAGLAARRGIIRTPPAVD